MFKHITCFYTLMDVSADIPLSNEGQKACDLRQTVI